MIQFCSVSVFFFSVLSSVFLPVYAFSVPFSYPSFFFVLSQLCLLLVSSPILSSLVLFCPPSFLLFPPVLFFFPLLFSFSFILSSLFYTPYCFYSSPPPFYLNPFFYYFILSSLSSSYSLLLFSVPFLSLTVSSILSASPLFHRLLLSLLHLSSCSLSPRSEREWNSGGHREADPVVQRGEVQQRGFRRSGTVRQLLPSSRLVRPLRSGRGLFIFPYENTLHKRKYFVLCFFFFNIVLCSSFDSLATAGSPAAGSQRCRGKVWIYYRISAPKSFKRFENEDSTRCGSGIKKTDVSRSVWDFSEPFDSIGRDLRRSVHWKSESGRILKAFDIITVIPSLRVSV